MSDLSALDKLPNISGAKLPAMYQAAQHALAECSRIDECQAWADKAESLASYAKQSKDETLRKYADRIQARAIRRCGEMLKQIPAAKNQHASTAAGTSRKQAATDAGLSKRQKDTALRVASVPAADFERQVESPKPPTVTQLAQQGKATKPAPLSNIGTIPPADYARATEAQGTLRRFAEFCQKYEPERIAKAFKPHEIKQLRRHVATVDNWLDRFVVNLPE